MVNTIAPYLLCRAFAEGMIRLGWGRIVSVTSAAALHEPGPINSAYGTSKAALNQFTRHLAAELAGSGVTANVIHPGDVKTEMWADIREKARGLGPEAARYQEWADWVEATGGDDPEKASDLIEALLGERAGDDQRTLPLDPRRAAGADPELGRFPAGRSLAETSAVARRPKAEVPALAAADRPAATPGSRSTSSTASSTSSAPGMLRAGDRLPSERELIDIFGISRPSLREALRALSILGVVDSRHGGGAFVTDLEARTLLAPLDFFLSLSETNLADAFEARRIVEIEIVRQRRGRGHGGGPRRAARHARRARQALRRSGRLPHPRQPLSCPAVGDGRQCRPRTARLWPLQHGPRHPPSRHRGPGADPPQPRGAHRHRARDRSAATPRRRPLAMAAHLDHIEASTRAAIARARSRRRRTRAAARQDGRSEAGA